MLGHSHLIDTVALGCVYKNKEKESLRARPNPAYVHNPAERGYDWTI